MEGSFGYTSKEIYSALKEEILKLTLKPGQQISENDICQRFSVSRTPVRTAFLRLRDEGLLNVIPYKTSCVAFIDFHEISDIIYMRVAVEAMVLRDFIKAADPLTLEKIRHNLKQQEIMLGRSFEPDEFYLIDSKLHNIWFRFTDKLSLWRLIEKAQVSYTRFRMLDIVEVKNFNEIYGEHLELFKIIKDKDYNAVEEIISRHLYGGIHRLGARIDTEFKDYFLKEPKPD